MLVPAPDIDAMDEPFPDGDVFALALPTGDPISLRFASPFEPWLTLDGARVTLETSKELRPLLIWLSRRLPALMHALEQRLGLLGVLTSQGVVVTDVVELENGTALDHGSLATLLEASMVQLPSFASLGTAANRSEILQRARATWAAGTPLELRIEADAQVKSRRRLRVGRS